MAKLGASPPPKAHCALALFCIAVEEEEEGGDDDDDKEEEEKKDGSGDCDDFVDEKVNCC